MKNWFFYAGSCYECEKNARYYSLVCLGVMLFFLAIVMVVFADKVDKFRKYAMGTKKKLKKMQKQLGGKDERKRAAQLGTIVFILSLITYFQIQALIVSVNVPWPNVIVDFFKTLTNMINFDIWGMINPQCSVTISFEASWLIRLISPVAILVPVSGGIYWYSLKPGREDMSNRAVSVTVQVLHMMFVGTTLHSLIPMDCTDYIPAVKGPNGETLDPIRVIDRFPKVPCDYSDTTYFRMFVASLVGFVLYTIAYVLLDRKSVV